MALGPSNRTILPAVALFALLGCPSKSEAPPPADEPREAEARPKPADEASASADLVERLQQAERDLDVAQQTIQILASPFPKDGPEVAAAWKAMIDTCDVDPWSVTLLDCTEYPCFVALGRSGDASPPPPGPERLEERMEVEQKLRTCPAVVQALGEDFDEGAVAASWQTKTCGGKDVAFWAATVLDPGGTAFELANDDDETQRESEHLRTWAQRRVEVLKLRHPCPGT